MPSGVNPTLGCDPYCRSKHYYLPGKGVWAPQNNSGVKATIGALGGAAAGAYLGSKSGPLAAATYGVVGLVLGHEVGAMFDKIDAIAAASLLDRTCLLYTSPSPRD